MNRNDMPVGFAMALGMNPDAMQRYVDALGNNKL